MTSYSLGHKAALLPVMGMALTLSMITSGCDSQMQPGNGDPGQQMSQAKLPDACKDSGTVQNLCQERIDSTAALTSCKEERAAFKTELDKLKGTDGCDPTAFKTATVNGKTAQISIKAYSCRTTAGNPMEYATARFMQTPQFNKNPGDCRVAIMEVTGATSMIERDFCEGKVLGFAQMRALQCGDVYCQELEGTN